MTNKEYYYKIKKYAFNSVYWIRYATRLGSCMESYAPMIEDKVFLSVCAPDETIGALEMEERLQRPIKLEELQVVNLSIPYFLFACPMITETAEEFARLSEFEEFINRGINRNENRSIRSEIKRLYKLYNYE